MINVFEYANISAHVYNTNKDVSFNIGKYQEGIKPQSLDGWYFVPKATDAKPESAFYGLLYLKFEKGKATDAVFAVRGTINTKLNYAVDIDAWANNVVGDCMSTTAPPCFPILWHLYSQADNYVQKYCPEISGVKVTGHSLGGAIAGMITALAGRHYPAVAFNAPGIGQIKGINQDYVPLVHNINSRYGVVNKVGESFGEVIYIDVTQQEQEAKELFRTFDVKDFEEGTIKEMSYNPSTIASGIYQKSKVLTQAYKTISKMTEFKQDLAHCQSSDKENTGMFASIENDIHDEECKVKSAGHTATDILASQHSIANIITALSQPKNASVAYRSI